MFILSGRPVLILCASDLPDPVPASAYMPTSLNSRLPSSTARRFSHLSDTIPAPAEYPVLITYLLSVFISAYV